MRTLVTADVHGAHKALLQCFARSGFDHSQDRLIVLGDVCDGYPQVCQCIEELLLVKHCDYIIGNHDLWALQWATTGAAEEAWMTQGGRSTRISYNDKMPQAHIDFLKNAHKWLEFDNKLFVHGGLDPQVPIAKQDLLDLVWDRNLIFYAHELQQAGHRRQLGPYTEIYVGHTPTQHFQSAVPVHLCNVWGMDTGAGWSGTLTIMDVDTKEYWQSDSTPRLYGFSSTH